MSYNQILPLHGSRANHCRFHQRPNPVYAAHVALSWAALGRFVSRQGYIANTLKSMNWCAAFFCLHRAGKIKSAAIFALDPHLKIL